MILGLHDARKIAEDIVRLSLGDCGVCGQPIGEKYCAAAQIFPRKLRVGLSINLRYRVVCAECHAAIKAALDERAGADT